MEKIGVPKLPSDQNTSSIHLRGRDLLVPSQISCHGVGNFATKSKFVSGTVWKIRIIDTVASGQRAKMTPSCQDADSFSKCGGTTQKRAHRHA